MKKIVVRATTTARRVGNGFRVTTRVSNGKTTRTVTKFVRGR